MSEKVYVVTAGSYSDYHIVGVFDTIQAAEAITTDDDDRVIEEYELNPIGLTRPDGMFCYRMFMSWDGVAHNVNREACREADDNFDGTYIHECGMLVLEAGRRDYHQVQGISTTVLARSKEHAVKIANERRTMLLAAKAAGGGEEVKQLAGCDRVARGKSQ